MNHFEVRDGEMYCEGVRLAEIAAAVGSPVYVYSSATVRRHFAVFSQAVKGAGGVGDPLVAYAVKANGNLAVLRLLAELGAGADTVSEGEIRRALKAGVPGERIVLSGVGKTDAELAYALDAGLYQLNVETASELRRLAAIAAELNIHAPVAIRVNPGLGAGGHQKITTGGTGDKFGVTPAEALELYAEAARTPSLRPVGLACHIGSQISDLEPSRAAFARMRAMVETLRGGGLPVERLDLGGGLGVPYFDQPEPPPPARFAQIVHETVDGLGVQLIFEPGRMIVANAGVLLAEVVSLHPRPDGGPKFLVLNAGMNDLMRPALYEAYHDIRPVKPRPGAEPVAFDVVGPVCETGDTFTRGRLLPPLEPGDLVAFMTAGAYGAAMSNQYNSRRLVPEVLVDGDRWAVVRRRPSYEEMFAAEVAEPW